MDEIYRLSGHTIDDPLDGGRHHELARWGFVYDFDEDVGGFASGDYLLRSDGQLLWRSAVSASSGGRATYLCSPWKVSTEWHGGQDPAVCESWLRRHRRYQLTAPSPVPLDRRGS